MAVFVVGESLCESASVCPTSARTALLAICSGHIGRSRLATVGAGRRIIRMQVCRLVLRPCVLGQGTEVDHQVL